MTVTAMKYPITVLRSGTGTETNDERGVLDIHIYTYIYVYMYLEQFLTAYFMVK